MDHPLVHPDAAPVGVPVDLEMGHAPPLPAPPGGRHPVTEAQLVWHRRPSNSWAGNDANTLLVVATLSTTLTYQLGTSSIPGGYWQQDVPARSPPQDAGTPMYRAGDPIMRDLHRSRYWVFVGASWMGFASSVVMTLSLLVRMAVGSWWSFAAAYSSLGLTFVVLQPRTHLSANILIWAAVLAFLWATVSLHPEHLVRAVRDLCCSRRDN